MSDIASRAPGRGRPPTLLRGGTVVDGSGADPRPADVLVHNGLITAVGPDLPPPADAEVVDAGGRLVLPGFVDTHCHADATIFDDAVAHAFLRQGVTTVIAGQDGVSYAPGDGRYAGAYFAAINGPHPSYDGGGVAALLAAYDDAVPVNAAYLVPLGTVRHEVLGYATGPADPGGLAEMAELVARGLREGAVGVSSGLDYVPNAHQDAAELGALCAVAARVGAPYVTHMRGGYEEHAHVGTAEIALIARASGVSVHISHYHGEAGDLIRLLDELERDGVDVTFDAYPYRRGCTILSMICLPPELLSGPTDVVGARLADPAVRDHLVREWFPAWERDTVLGPHWPEAITLAHVPSSTYDWAHGLTVAAAAPRTGRSPAGFVCDLLADTLDVLTVVKVRHQRSYDAQLPLFTDRRFLGGSDGISVGRHPHPRAFGAFARYLRMFVREFAAWDWPHAARHLAARPAARFGLLDRGMVRPGWVADLVLVDPERVADTASYEGPRSPAVGIDDVLVNGVWALRTGELTGATPGRGLRRTGPGR